MKKGFSVTLFILIVLFTAVLFFEREKVIGFVTSSVVQGAKDRPGPTESSPVGVRQNTRLISLVGHFLEVEIAASEQDRSRGLSGRPGLEPGTGMLFVFDVPAQYGFWMKDMNFPIDIIWISNDEKIVHIEKNVSPDSYPKIFTPNRPAKAVLEVSAGLSETLGLKIGDSVNWK